jgi:hypothetical protein
LSHAFEQRLLKVLGFKATMLPVANKTWATKKDKILLEKEKAEFL